MKQKSHLFLIVKYQICSNLKLRRSSHYIRLLDLYCTYLHYLKVRENDWSVVDKFFFIKKKIEKISEHLHPIAFPFWIWFHSIVCGTFHCNSSCWSAYCWDTSIITSYLVNLPSSQLIKGGRSHCIVSFDCMFWS